MSPFFSLFFFLILVGFGDPLNHLKDKRKRKKKEINNIIAMLICYLSSKSSSIT